jgi:hypothetical protein
MYQHHCTGMLFVRRIEILLGKAKRDGNTVHKRTQYQETRFMESRNCITKF